MKYEEMRQQMIAVCDEVETKANKAELFYVVCFWKSPITNRLEHRTGYFDSIGEALNFSDVLRSTYIKYGFPYYISSNVSSADLDGGLL